MKKRKLLLPMMVLAIMLVACGRKPVEQAKEEKKENLEQVEEKNLPIEEKKESLENAESGVTNAKLEEFASEFSKIYGTDKITSIKVKESKLGRIYEVQGYDEKFEYETKFSEAGEVIKEEKDMLEPDDIYENNPFTVEEISDVLSYEEILAVVSKETDNYVESVKLEKGLKGFIYEVDTEGRMDLELIIDASTGEILHYDD